MLKSGEDARREGEENVREERKVLGNKEEIRSEEKGLKRKGPENEKETRRETMIGGSVGRGRERQGERKTGNTREGRRQGARRGGERRKG